MATRSGLVVLFGWSLFAAAGAACAQDFVFGDNFETGAVCPAGPTPAIAAVISPGGVSTRLGTSNNFLVKVLSCGYAGSVTMTPSGTPVNWTVHADPATFSLASGATRAVLVNASIPTNGDAGFVTMNVGAQALTANSVPLSANLDVADEVLVVIREGTGTDPAAHPFPQLMHIRVGSKYRVYSDDSTDSHIIHADGVPGYLHQSTAGTGLLKGQEYDLIATSAGSGHVYCHNHGYGAYDPQVIVP